MLNFQIFLEKSREIINTKKRNPTPAKDEKQNVSSFIFSQRNELEVKIPFPCRGRANRCYHENTEIQVTEQRYLCCAIGSEG